MALSAPQFAINYGQAAIDAAAGSNIFPAVILSVAALESGYAGSTLSNTYNNFFGRKAEKSWTGKTVTLPTKEVLDGKTVTVNAKFKWYDTAEDGFRDYVRLMQTARYNNAGVNDADTPEEQVTLIRAAGYATDPNYASKVISIIATLSASAPAIKKKVL